MSNRANGRTGMGAVMGSKNLKAIVVRGKVKPDLADPHKLLDLAKWGANNFEDSDIYGLGLLGTAGIINSQNQSGGLPTRNWESGFFENANAISGETMSNKILKDRSSCYACTVRCKRVVQVTKGPYLVDPKYGGPEYETLAGFGSYCGVDDLEAIAYANQLCNMYGLDTISCGATIAWTMNCFERGILSLDDTEGIDLRFGNAEAMVKITEKIAKREGLGDILAEGSARAASKIGKCAKDFVVAVKNQELPAHMPQSKRSLALIYAVNPFGADHQSSEHDSSYNFYPEQMKEIGLTDPQPADVLNRQKVYYALTTQYVYSCLDTLNVCQFVFGPAWQLYSLGQLSEIVNAVTGWDVNVEELLLIGERRLNIQRSFNAREGIGREFDKFPKKLEKTLVGGKSDGLFVTSEEVEKAKDWYYKMAGWDVTTGVPKRSKLKEIGLDWVADMLIP
jgi:aldehyde:ferredoxin oxidoreductase